MRISTRDPSDKHILDELEAELFPGQSESTCEESSGRETPNQRTYAHFRHALDPDARIAIDVGEVRNRRDFFIEAFKVGEKLVSPDGPLFSQPGIIPVPFDGASKEKWEAAADSAKSAQRILSSEKMLQHIRFALRTNRPCFAPDEVFQAGLFAIFASASPSRPSPSVQRLAVQLFSHMRALCNLTIDPDCLKVELGELIMKDAEVCVDRDEIPIKVCLGFLELTLEEILSLRKGSTLILPPISELPVRLQLSGLTIAEGRLSGAADQSRIEIEQVAKKYGPCLQLADSIADNPVEHVSFDSVAAENSREHFEMRQGNACANNDNPARVAALHGKGKVKSACEGFEPPKRYAGHELNFLANNHLFTGSAGDKNVADSSDGGSIVDVQIEAGKAFGQKLEGTTDSSENCRQPFFSATRDSDRAKVRGLSGIQVRRSSADIWADQASSAREPAQARTAGVKNASDSDGSDGSEHRKQTLHEIVFGERQMRPKPASQSEGNGETKPSRADSIRSGFFRRGTRTL